MVALVGGLTQTTKIKHVARGLVAKHTNHVFVVIAFWVIPQALYDFILWNVDDLPQPRNKETDALKTCPP